MELTVIPFVFPGLPRVRCAFQTSRVVGRGLAEATGNVGYTNGDAPATVDATRQRLQAQLGFPHWQECRQVHGDALLLDPPLAEESPRNDGGVGCAPLREADGLATSKAGQGLVIKTADCQPLLLAHQDGAFVSALHVGWRGNRLGFPQSAVQRLCAHYGVRPEELLAVRGPSLGPACSEFVNYEQEWGPTFRPFYCSATRTVDLWRLTRAQLREAGLRPERIFGVDLCTYSLPELFFSYRRDKTQGRQAAVIWLE